MHNRDLYVFLWFPGWQFYAVEAATSDEALLQCLKDKGWKLSELIYLGSMEGRLPHRPSPPADGFPPQTQEPRRGYRFLNLSQPQ